MCTIKIIGIILGVSLLITLVIDTMKVFTVWVDEFGRKKS